MKNNSNKFRVISIIVAIIVAIIIGIALRDGDEENDMKLTYGEVINAVQDEEVESISTYQNSHTFKVYLKEEADKGDLPEHMYIMIAPNIDEFTSFIAEEIKSGNPIEFEVEEKDSTVTALVSLLGSLLPIIFLFYYMNKMMNGNGMKIKPIRSDVRFDDVAGIDEEKRQVEEIVEFLRNPERYRRIGATIPKGVLLSGDPGTGKTLLAKAIAGEAGVPFFQVNGSSFEEKFVGVGASRVRKLFNEAKRMAPAIIFIDELDSVAQARYGSKANYSEQTLNQLLSEMDGFDTQDNVIVIAATNHIEVLDPAIRRPGRFDRTVFIPNSDAIARKAILEVHARNKQFDESVSLEQIARKTVGFSGADLENILNEAAIYAVNQGKSVISQEDISEAIARVIAGLRKNNSAITENDKWLTAVHEAGHAVVSALVRPDVKNFEISIIPRGNAGGYNFFDDANIMYPQKKTLLAKLKVLYGGRIAEELIIGDISTGAANDCEKASQVAHDMVVKYAMAENFLTKLRGVDDYNAELERIAFSEAQNICKETYEEAKKLLESQRHIVHSLAILLQQKEYISQEEIEKFFETKGIKVKN